MQDDIARGDIVRLEIRLVLDTLVDVTEVLVTGLEQLLEACYEDFGDVYKRVKDQPDFEAHDIAPGDVILQRGTLAYFQKKKAS